jgi:hypothetical protein
MSLDTLFTEAAEAGGPPRFTEHDIAHRVTVRRVRRRRIATAGAALVVVAGVALGLAAATRGGSDDPPVQPVPGDEIPAVPITEQALLGEWRVVVPDGSSLDVDTVLTFGTDGVFSFRGCSVGNGAYVVMDGELVRTGASTPRAGCAGDGAWATGLDGSLAAGIATFYEDGLLRLSNPLTPPVDLVRADDSTPPDTETPRAEAATIVPVSDNNQVAGSWTVAGASGASLTLDADGTYQFSDCAEGNGTWRAEYGVTILSQPTMTLEPPCLPSDRPELVAALGDGAVTLTSEDKLYALGPGQLNFLVLVREGASAPAAPAELTGTWVRAADEVDSVPQASVIEFGDGAYRMATTCGTVDGTYAAEGGQVTMTLTSSDLGPACDVFYQDIEVDHAELADGRLTINLAVSGTVPDGVDLIREYVRFDQLAVPSAEDLVDTWGSPLLAEVMPQPLGTFSAGGTLAFACGTPTPWSLNGDQLQIDVPDGPCEIGYALDPGPHELDVRLDGDVLYLRDGDHVTILRRGAGARLPGPPAAVLQDAYEEMGVEACCGEPSHGSDVSTSGFVHEGSRSPWWPGPWAPSTASSPSRRWRPSWRAGPRSARPTAR